jgi:hypothetical protein
MDMSLLKPGQRLYLSIYSKLYEATVGEMNGPSHGWGNQLVTEYVRIEIANWDGSSNGSAKGCAIDFTYDGKQICGWHFMDSWDPRPFEDLEIILLEEAV